MLNLKLHNKNLSDYSFLVTGGAGFIGSNLCEYLVKNGAKLVRVLDDLSTGYYENIREFEGLKNFEFLKGDIRNYEDCNKACLGIDIVLHQAALGSVPRSMKDPITSNAVNVDGFVNMLQAAKENNIKRFVYASSSSVYGDDTTMPKVESKTGNLLSPYAVTKYTDELYAQVFSKVYGIKTIGMRYFNVFGPKQNIQGPYAAVIPIFITKLLNDEAPGIHGDGNNTRDFTFIANVIKANLCASFAENVKEDAVVLNIAYGGTTSVNDLFNEIAHILDKNIKAIHLPVRKGDIKDSFANIDKAKELIGYTSEVDLKTGLKITVDWYKTFLGK
jgi:UDP-N-acetylglucosamine/UDP-N-acetylgalactosamine 4-epimerase